MAIIFVFIIIEVIVILMGYFIFQKDDSITWKVLNKGKDESLPHFWIFYHLKIYGIFVLLMLINIIFGRHSKIGYIIKKAINK